MVKQPRVNRTISVLYRYSQRFFTQRLKSCAMSIEVGQIPFIMQVYKNPGITQDGISVNAVMDKGTTAKAIVKLEKLGLVLREVDHNDRRINHIYPTQKALDIKDQILAVIGDLHEILYQGLDPSEVDLAICLLDKMKCNISNYLDKED